MQNIIDREATKIVKALDFIVKKVEKPILDELKALVMTGGNSDEMVKVSVKLNMYDRININDEKDDGLSILTKGHVQNYRTSRDFYSSLLDLLYQHSDEHVEARVVYFIISFCLFYQEEHCQTLKALLVCFISTAVVHLSYLCWYV